MGQNFLRSCSLSLSGASGGATIVNGGGETDLRVAFQVESHTLQSPDLAQFVIFNASQSTAAKVQKEFTEVSFSAGYASNVGQIFKGSIVETQYGEKVEGFTTTLLRIWWANSDLAYNQARVNQTLAAGHTPQDIVDTCLKAMQPYGVTMGQVLGVDLSQPRFPRGATLVGMARDYLREIAMTKGATYTLSNSQLSIIAKDATISSGNGPTVLSAQTGMLEQPIQRPEGVIVKCLINPAITVNSLVQIKSNIISPSINGSPVLPDLTTQKGLLDNQLSSDGVYRVLHVQIDGDTRGPDWTMTLTTIGNGQKTNTVQAGLGYS